MLLFIYLISTVAFETHSDSLITVKHNGFIGYTFGQFIKSQDFVAWYEIYKVEPYRYYGLPFLLVRFHSSDMPLWLPLFLTNQNKLNRAIIERTTEDNPLHVALLQKDSLFKGVPWHSKIKKHKSDRYILERSYAERIDYSFKNLYIFILLFSLPWIITTIIIENALTQFWVIDMSLVVLFILGMTIFTVKFLIIKSYIEIQDTGIEICSELIDRQRTRCFIPWQEIIKVKYSQFWIFSEFHVFIKDYSNSIKFSSPAIKISLWLMNPAKFKAAVINQTHADNLLHEAVVKYL